VIIRAGYDCTADVWSFACMVFELVTGDYLFDPKSTGDFDRDEDHLALIIELVGPMSLNFVSRGRHSHRFFRERSTDLRRIDDLRFWPLVAVLREKYHMGEAEAVALSDFLVPMLAPDPLKRQGAKQMLDHPWLRMRSPEDEVAYCEMRNNMHVSRPNLDAPLLSLSPGHSPADLAVDPNALCGRRPEEVHGSAPPGTAGAACMYSSAPGYGPSPPVIGVSSPYALHQHQQQLQQRQQLQQLQQEQQHLYGSGPVVLPAGGGPVDAGNELYTLQRQQLLQQQLQQQQQLQHLQQQQQLQHMQQQLLMEGLGRHAEGERSKTTQTAGGILGVVGGSNTGCSSTAVTAASSSSGRAGAATGPAAAAAAAASAARMLMGYPGTSDPQYFRASRDCWDGRSVPGFPPIGSNNNSSGAGGLRPEAGGVSGWFAAPAAGDAPQQQQPQQQQQQQQQIPSARGEVCGSSSADKRPDGLHQGGSARVSATPVEAEVQAVAAPAGDWGSVGEPVSWIPGAAVMQQQQLEQQQQMRQHVQEMQERKQEFLRQQQELNRMLKGVQQLQHGLSGSS
ncbi:CMCG kinase (incomplete catalytic triad), putative, partial [Eimeria maxima]